MLHLLNKLTYARVFLGEKHMVVCVIQGKYNPRVIQSIFFDLEHESLVKTFESLKKWLMQNFKGKFIEWILGIHYVRHLTLPWNKKHLDKDFSINLASKLFVNKFQQDIESYETRIMKFGYGEPLLASFFDKIIIQQIMSFMESNVFKTKTIEPLLSIVWNRFYEQLNKKKLLLCIVDGSRVLVVEKNSNCITNLYLYPYQKNSLLDYVSINNREILLFNPLEEINGEFKCLFINHLNKNNIYSYPLCGIF